MKNMVDYVFKHIPQYIDEINDAITKFWNSEGLEIVHKDEKRVIKAYRSQEYNSFFILDKRTDNINVYSYLCEYEKLKNSIKEHNIFKYIEKSIKENAPLYLQKIVENDRSVRPFEYNLEYMSVEELEAGREEVEKNNFGEDVLILFDKELELRRKNESVEKKWYSLSCDVDVLQSFSKILIDKEYYDKINVLASLQYDSHLKDWGLWIQNIIKVANEKGYTTKENGFWFNDADNQIYALSDNEMVFRHQEYAMYMVIKDVDNYGIYQCSMEGKNSNVKSVVEDSENIILAVLDGKIIKSKYIMLNGMNISLELGYQDISNAKKNKINKKRLK